MHRRKTREINLGGVKIGGNNPVSVQSMTKTDTTDIQSTVEQIKRLEKVGCEIIRVAVLNMNAAEVLDKIIGAITIPLIADIHFDYRLALKAVEKGVDGLRLNPGNIGSVDRVREVVKACKEKSVPIRIGVNAGSLEKDLLQKFKHPTAEAMVESALRHVRILEDLDFHDIKISLKASHVPKTVDAYRLLAEKVDYPFHVGITEAGTPLTGTVKSSVGLGALLINGIGDTMRVSLTDDPEEEVKVGYEILKALGLRERGVNIVSCPTCGRIRVDVISMATAIEKRLAHIDTPINIAVMGCVVNGPGEATESDIGITGGDGVGKIYIKGKAVSRVKEDRIIDEVVRVAEDMAKERKNPSKDLKIVLKGDMPNEI